MNTFAEWEKEVASSTSIAILEVKPQEMLDQFAVNKPLQQRPVISLGQFSFGLPKGSNAYRMRDEFMPELYSNMGQSSSYVHLQVSEESVFFQLTVHVDNTPSSTSITEQIPHFLEQSKVSLVQLASDYVTGKLDIPDLVKQLGKPWTASKVVLLLERLGAHRPLSKTGLPQQKKLSVLNRLAEIRETSGAEEFNSPDWIQREVIASQRIESVYVPLEQFPPNY